jgi:AcrR family transcriptional regulator
LPRQDRAERTRNLILDAAAEAFEARGFAGASLSDILTRAGVTKGALYFHFASKEELAKALVDEQWRTELPSLEDTTDPLQTVIDMCHAYCRDLCTNIRVRASNRLMAESNLDRPFPQACARWTDQIRQLLEAARDAGDLRPEWDPAEVASYVCSAVVGIQTTAGAVPDREDMRDRLTNMWKISLPGLVPARRLSRFRPSGTIEWDSTAA